MQRLKDILLVGLLLGSALMAGAQSLQKFPAGSKVAFVGNSITEAGYYESYIWLYYMTRFPGERIEVMNVGIGGNTMKDIAARFDEDVVKRNPSAIVLTFGMNDSGYFEYNGAEPQKEAEKKVAASRESFLPLVEKLKALPAQKIMMSSSPYDETMKNKDNYFPGKSKAMERIIAFQKEAAAANQWSFVDLFYPMQQINLEGQKNNPEFTIIGKDRIHPGNGGHLVMAYLFLKAQGLAGTPLVEVEVDARKKVIKKSAGADVSGLTVANGVAFDYLAKALPFPVDSASRMWGSDQKQSDALSVVPFIQDFNQELLRVTGLTAAQYEVKIDGNVMGTWKKEELAAGINLALVVKTPQYKQAVQIANLNQARKEFEGKLRDYYGLEFIFFQPRGMLFQDDQAAYDLASKQAKKDWVVGGKIGAYESLRFPEVRQSYVNQMKFLVDMIYDMNKPKSHRIEVVVLGAGKTK